MCILVSLTVIIKQYKQNMNIEVVNILTQGNIILSQSPLFSSAHLWCSSPVKKRAT